MLSQRYASPFLILDEFIRLHQFHEFTFEILNTIAEEKIEKTRWEYYLSRVWDMSFDEYVKVCENKGQEENEMKPEQMTPEQIGNVINESRNILEGFVP